MPRLFLLCFYAIAYAMMFFRRLSPADAHAILPPALMPFSPIMFSSMLFFFAITFSMSSLMPHWYAIDFRCWLILFRWYTLCYCHCFHAVGLTYWCPRHFRCFWFRRLCHDAAFAAFRYLHYYFFHAITLLMSLRYYTRWCWYFDISCHAYAILRFARHYFAMLFLPRFQVSPFAAAFFACHAILFFSTRRYALAAAFSLPLLLPPAFFWCHCWLISLDILRWYASLSGFRFDVAIISPLLLSFIILSFWLLCRRACLIRRVIYADAVIAYIPLFRWYYVISPYWYLLIITLLADADTLISLSCSYYSPPLYVLIISLITPCRRLITLWCLIPYFSLRLRPLMMLILLLFTPFFPLMLIARAWFFFIFYFSLTVISMPHAYTAILFWYMPYILFLLIFRHAVISWFDYFLFCYCWCSIFPYFFFFIFVIILRLSVLLFALLDISRYVSCRFFLLRYMPVDFASYLLFYAVFSCTLVIDAPLHVFHAFAFFSACFIIFRAILFCHAILRLMLIYAFRYAYATCLMFVFFTYARWYYACSCFMRYYATYAIRYYFAIYYYFSLALCLFRFWFLLLALLSRPTLLFFFEAPDAAIFYILCWYVWWRFRYAADAILYHVAPTFTLITYVLYIVFAVAILILCATPDARLCLLLWYFSDAC